MDPAAVRDWRTDRAWWDALADALQRPAWSVAVQPAVVRDEWRVAITTGHLNVHITASFALDRIVVEAMVGTHGLMLSAVDVPAGSVPADVAERFVQRHGTDIVAFSEQLDALARSA